MSKHTTGWRTDGMDRGALVMAGHVVASADAFKPDGASYEEGMANIALASAAEDLLAALEAMIKRFGSPDGWPLDPDTAAEEIAARAAIAKAKGGK